MTLHDLIDRITSQYIEIMLEDFGLDKMDIMKKTVRFLYFFVFLCMILTVQASAYIDPATTAMLTQIVAGVFITFGVVFGVFRRKIILFFKNMSVNHTKRKIERQVKKQSTEKGTERNEEKELKHNEEDTNE